MLKGLDWGPDTEELEKIGLPPKEIFQMKNTGRKMYLAIFSKDVLIRHLQAKARILLNCQIIWERHENKRQIIQCRNCQEWGHATSNCYAEVVCMVCAENHPTRDCTVNKEELVKCANCAGNHRASSTLCPSYQRIIQMSGQQQPEKTKINYVQAPPPKTNPWQQRQQQQQQQHQQQQQQQHQQYHQVRPATSVSENNASASAKNRAQSGASDIFAAMKGLNEACNIGEMLRAISDLTNVLSACRNKQEKFIAFVKFTENLDNYAL